MINIDGIKNHLQDVYQFGVEHIGTLESHMIRFLNLVRSDARVAGATVAVANILIFKIAVKVAGLVDGLFGSRKNRSKKAVFAYSVLCLSMVSLLCTGMNMALYKGLKSPLTPVVTVAISITTCVGYSVFCLLRREGVNKLRGKGVNKLEE